MFTEITAINTPAYKTGGAICIYMKDRIKIKNVNLLKNSNGQFGLKSNCLIFLKNCALKEIMEKWVKWVKCQE